MIISLLKVFNNIEDPYFTPQFLTSLKQKQQCSTAIACSRHFLSRLELECWLFGHAAPHAMFHFTQHQHGGSNTIISDHTH